MRYRPIPLNTDPAVLESKEALRCTVDNIYDVLDEGMPKDPDYLATLLRTPGHGESSGDEHFRRLYTSLSDNIGTLIASISNSGTHILGLFEAVATTRVEAGPLPINRDTSSEDSIKLEIYRALDVIKHMRTMGAIATSSLLQHQGEDMAYSLADSGDIAIVKAPDSIGHLWSYEVHPDTELHASQFANWLLGIPDHYPSVFIRHANVPHSIGHVALGMEYRVDVSAAAYLLPRGMDESRAIRRRLRDVRIGNRDVESMIREIDGGIYTVLIRLLRLNDPAVAVPYIESRFGSLGHTDIYDAFHAVQIVYGQRVGRRQDVNKEGKKWLRELGVVGV